MQVSGALEQYDRFRTDVFRSRDGLSLERKLALSVLMALATGIMAQIRFPLPWTPVPITGQVFAVLLSGIMLGGRFGALSQVFYVALGTAGVPWFTGFTAGMNVMSGPTGGYLIGFIPAALFIGRMIERYPAWRTIPRLFAIMALSTALFIYMPGILQLALWQRTADGYFPGTGRLLMVGVIPFLPGDVVKIILAACSARILGPPACGGRFGG
ncbi:MAG: biotin transporter BioY [Sphaerochaetaceae bacterium]|nr:biotin transporter BioY [Sphaerochaetaceae bacterium]